MYSFSFSFYHIYLFIYSSSLSYIVGDVILVQPENVDPGFIKFLKQLSYGITPIHFL